MFVNPHSKLDNFPATNLPLPQTRSVRATLPRPFLCRPAAPTSGTGTGNPLCAHVRSSLHQRFVEAASGFEAHCSPAVLPKLASRLVAMGWAAAGFGSSLEQIPKEGLPVSLPSLPSRLMDLTEKGSVATHWQDSVAEATACSQCSRCWPKPWPVRGASAFWLQTLQLQRGLFRHDGSGRSCNENQRRILVQMRSFGTADTCPGRGSWSHGTVMRPNPFLDSFVSYSRNRHERKLVGDSWRRECGASLFWDLLGGFQELSQP